MTVELNVPVLETPRLILRGHRLADFEEYLAIGSDPIVRRFFASRPVSREDSWGRFLRHFGSWAALGRGCWAVEEKESGAYIGPLGIFDSQRDIEPRLDDLWEAGWTLASRVHGKGYATEAMGAAFEWVDAQRGRPNIFCIIAPENKASIRVAEKTGFRYWRDTVFKGEPTLVFLRDRPPK